MDRHFELRSTLSHDDRYFVTASRSRSATRTPTSRTARPGEVRRIDTQRYEHLKGSKLVTRQHPALAVRVAEAASTDLTGPEALQECGGGLAGARLGRSAVAIKVESTSRMCLTDATQGV